MNPQLFFASPSSLPISGKRPRRWRSIVCTQTPPQVFDPKTSSLNVGIRSVSIGKNGSKPIPAELYPSLIDELSLSLTEAAFQWQRASFLGSLFVKKELLDAEHGLLTRFCRNTPFRAGRERIGSSGVISAGEVLAAVSTKTGELEQFAFRLLNDEPLSTEDCVTLGSLLYSPNELDENVKVLIAHVMRIRHETSEELAGLSVAVSRTIAPQFHRTNGSGFALLAEPYDGTATWDLLTPLLAKRLMDWGLKPIMNVGETSGPKYGPNLRDVCRELGIRCAQDTAEIDKLFADGVSYGVCVDQRDSSPGLSQWIKMRRAIVKRPSIATTEKFLDPTPAATSLFIASAFHTNYIAKMAYCAEILGYPAYIIVGRGMEGTLGLGVNPPRKGEFVFGWKHGNGEYTRERMLFSPSEEKLTVSKKSLPKDQCDAAKTAERIRLFSDGGSAGDEDDEVFRWRATATLKAFDKVLRIISEHSDVDGLHSVDDVE